MNLFIRHAEFLPYIEIRIIPRVTNSEWNATAKVALHSIHLKGLWVSMDLLLYGSYGAGRTNKRT